VLGLFLSEVLTIIGLYVMLGLGLNIIVGFSGCLISVTWPISRSALHHCHP